MYEWMPIVYCEKKGSHCRMARQREGKEGKKSTKNV